MDNNIQDEFDRLFADDLRQTDGLGKPIGKDWQGLSARLDSAEKKLPLYSWLSLLLLSAVAGILLWKGNAMQREIADLKQQIAAIGQRDTLPTTANLPAIVRYDTVYKTIVINRKIYGSEVTGSGVANLQGERVKSVRGKMTKGEITKSSLETNKVQVSSDQAVLDKNMIVVDVSQRTDGVGNFEKNISLPQVSNQTALVTQPFTADTSSRLSTATDAKLQTSADTVAQVALPGNTKEFGVVDSLLDAPSPPIIKKHKQPTRLQLGASLVPLLATTTEDIDLSHSIGWGIEAQLLCGRRWSLQANILYQQYKYEVDRRADDRFLRHRPSPLGQDYSFKRAEGQSMVLAPSLALLRYFNVDKKWNWYLGGGYGLRLFAPAEIEYEYINQNTGATARSRKKVDAFVRPLNLTTCAGTQFRLFPRWAVYVETSGMFDLGAGYRAHNLAGGSIGLRYLVK